MIGQKLGNARIVDRGYQHYGGPRLGQGHAWWVLARASARRGLGIRRSIKAKILPWLLIVTSLLPVVVLLAVRIFGSKAGVKVPTYGSFYDSITVLFLLFAGLIAPDLICPDRRERVITLYLASPLTRLGYVGAQVAALSALLGLLTLLPSLLLFIGNTLLADSAATYFGDHLADLGHIVLAGLLLALFYGSLALAIASFTDRRAYASGAFLGVVLVSATAGSILSEQMHFAGHERFALLNLPQLPIRAVRWLFGDSIDSNASTTALLSGSVDGVAFLVVSAGVIALSIGLFVWRYLQLRD